MKSLKLLLGSVLFARATLALAVPPHLKQAHRPALEDHVTWTARLDSRVLSRESCYKIKMGSAQTKDGTDRLMVPS